MEQVYIDNDLTFYTKKSLIMAGDPVKKKGYLYIGNFEAAKDIKNLDGLNIKYVLSSMEKSLLVDLQRKYKENGITHMIAEASDVPNCNIARLFPTTSDFIEAGLIQGNVMIHCFAGISRSTTLTLAYLMKKQRKPWRELLEDIKRKRPVANPNMGFQRHLTTLQGSLGIR